MLDVDLLDRAARRTDWASGALSAAAVDLREATTEGESVDGVAELMQGEAGRCVRQKNESALGKALSLPGGLGTSLCPTYQQAARREPQQSLRRAPPTLGYAARDGYLDAISELPLGGARLGLR